MSAGRSNKKKEPGMIGPHVVSLDPEEFNRVCRDVHRLLLARAEKARERKEKQPSKRAHDSHIEASKAVFVFIHLIELVENMTEEISDLRHIISEVTETEHSHPTSDVPEMFATNKKNFLN